MGDMCRVTYIRRRDVIEQGRSVTNIRANCYQSRGNRDFAGEDEV